MRRYYDNMYDEENPSSSLPEKPEAEKFKLPEDPEAEKIIKVEGMTTDELIDVVFQGIDLKSYDGTPFSRSSLATAINSAIDSAEMVFDICISPRDIKDELHDFEGESMFERYQYTPLYKRPVQKVDKMSFKIGNKEVLNVPLNWIQLDKRVGDITLFPTSGTMGFITPAFGAAVPHFMYRDFMPMSVSIDYRAGIEKKDMPTNLLTYIYKLASIDIFEVWGDQIIGAGIASSSVSIDGLSQSIGTTQSAMYGGASARILEYRKDLDTLTPILRKYFGRFDSVVL